MLLLLGPWALCAAAWTVVLRDLCYRQHCPVVHVSPLGNDWNVGCSPSNPVKTLAKALERVNRSGSVILHPGTYFERCHVHVGGTPDSPLSITALTPGTAIISWKESPNYLGHLKWEHLGGNVYSTAVLRPVYRLCSGEETLFRLPWGGVKELQKLASRPGAMSAFCLEGNTLAVYLQKGVHPEQAHLTTHRAVPVPREWGEYRSANMWIETDYVHVSGLRFEYGLGAGIHLWNANDIRITDCAFSGATAGIRCSDGLLPATNVIVERCLYHNYPQRAWRDGWLEWREVYAAYSSSTLLRSAHGRIVVRDSLVSHAGDPLQVTSTATRSSEGPLIEHNLLANYTDDGIEFDGPAKHVHARGNVLYNGYVSFAVSPVKEGPCLIDNNIAIHPDVVNSGAQFKLMGLRQQGAMTPIRNVHIQNNLMLGNWLAWRNAAPVSDVTARGNLFCIRGANHPRWPEGVADENSTYVPIPQESTRLAMADAVLRLKYASGDSMHVEMLQAAGRRHYGPAWWNYADHPATTFCSELTTALED